MLHLHEVRDTDNHFVIDPITRVITNPNSDKNKLMMGDHNSEVFTFEIPKFVESHDMGLCNAVRIHYNDISTNKADESRDFYTVKDMQIAEDDPNTLVFSWLISDTATKFAGGLSFRIQFLCIDEEGRITYKWHTDIFRGITISDGFDNVESIVVEHSDVLAQLERRLASKISSVALLASAWTGADSLYSQVVTVAGMTENSQVDLTPSVEQLAIFYNKDVTFVTENVDGVLTVYAIGQKPENDYTIQVTITEVYV